MAACTRHDHFHVLIFCALECERQAARKVMENGTDSEFVSTHAEIVTGLMLCRNWNKTPLTVAMISQPDTGETECTARLTELQKNFSVDLAVMTGTCAGAEDVHGGVEYGTVVIAKRTDIEWGKKTTDGGFLPQGNPAKLDARLISAIESVAGRLGRGTDWLNTIPQETWRPSPRYAQELILNEVLRSETKMNKKDLFRKLQSQEGLGQIDLRIWDSILKKTCEVDGWVNVSAGVVTYTQCGIDYKNDAFDFPRKDEINVIVDSIGTIRCGIENLPKVIGKYRRQMSDGQLKGIDMEAHHFMTHSKAAFPGCIPLVMKGVSDYGNLSKQDYYCEFAASTPVAFLRHLLTQQPFYILLGSVTSHVLHRNKTVYFIL